ncbi:hypothetical protein [Solidesulfovibrio sp.]
MTAPALLTLACPCGGHSLELPADKLPVGGRAALTCPACGVRRTFVRTQYGVAAGETPLPPAQPGTGTPATPAAPAAPAGPIEPLAPAGPQPSPVPPAAAVALFAADDAAWKPALTAALPPDWHVLVAAEAGQAALDVLAHAPRLVLLDDGAIGRAVATAVATLPGSQRQEMVLLALVPGPEADPWAAFTHSADAVLDPRDPADRAGRIRAARDRVAALPSLFDEGRG